MRGVKAFSRTMTFALAIVVILLLSVAVGSGQLLEPARELVEVAASKITSRQVGEPKGDATVSTAGPESLAFSTRTAERTAVPYTGVHDPKPIIEQGQNSPDQGPSKAIRVPPIRSSEFEDAVIPDESSEEQTAAAPVVEDSEPRANAAPSPPTSAAAPPATTAPGAANTTTTRAPATTTTTRAPTTTEAFPRGSAGHNGNVGCRSNCRNVGLQNLDGKNNFVLENVIVSNPGGRCLTARNASNITIRNVTFTNCGTEQGVKDGYGTGLVHIADSSNVTIENSKFENMAARHTIDLRNNALQIENSPNTRVVNNEFRNIHSDIGQKANDRGNRAILVRGNNSHDVTIERNSFFNPGRNALQIKEARDLRGVSFSNNRVEGRGAWDSDFEDMVNLFSSSGVPGSPIVLRGNYMRNGGSSISGTAIIVGDGNANAGTSRHIVVDRNVIMNPGHVGINLAGGDNISVTDNIIYGNQNVPHATTVGLIVNHFNYSPECRDHVVTGNRVYMQNQHQGGGVNHVWIPGTCSQNVLIDRNSFGDSSLHPGIWNLG